MIFRNSIKSICRTPVKTALFFLLLSVTSALLYLGVNTWASSVKMLEQTDEMYKTIAVMEYIGDDYPDENAYDESMNKAVESIDYDAIIGNKNVKMWQPTANDAGFLDGFTRSSSTLPYMYDAVLIIHDVIEFDRGRYWAKVERALASTVEMEKDKFVYFVPDESSGVTEFETDAYYAVIGCYTQPILQMQTFYSCGFSSIAAASAGVDCASIPLMEKITDLDAFLADKDNIYNKIADFYNTMNSVVKLCCVQDMEMVEDFHQRSLYVEKGRLFTEEEAVNGDRVCVITGAIAESMKLKVGDTLDLTTIIDKGFPASDCYWGEDWVKARTTYTIVGITNYDLDKGYKVYVPTQITTKVPTQYGYLIGSALLKNGHASEFIAEMNELLPERVRITVYDHGYQSVADSLESIRGTSIILTIVAAIAALTVLIFFGFLFVGRQRETVVTMLYLGTSKAKVRSYLMLGASAISLFASSLGGYIGFRYANLLVNAAFKMVSDLQAVDLRYSDAYLGVTEEFTPMASTDAILVFLVCGAMFILALVSCLMFTQNIIVLHKAAKKRRRRMLKPPNGSSAMRSPFKYTFLSIKRGGARSFAVPIVALIMTAFLLVLSQTAVSYGKMLEDVYDSTELIGRFTSMNGKTTDGLYLDRTATKAIFGSDYVESFSVSTRVRAMLGKKGVYYEDEFMDDPWALDTFRTQIMQSGYAYFTNDVTGANEFFGTEPEIEWADEYSSDYFKFGDYEYLPCILTNTMMNENDIEYGDMVSIYAIRQSDLRVVCLRAKVIGSFNGQAAKPIIYCAMPRAYYDFNYGDSIPLFYMNYASSASEITRMLGSSVFNSGSFKLKNARDIAEFKDWLQETGLSSPYKANFVRQSTVIYDMDFDESVIDLKQRIGYMDILLPALYILIAATGLIVSYLTVNGRREELAIMRGTGTSKARVFAVFFLEQTLLCLIGTLIGTVAAALFGVNPFASAYSILLFLACYLVGSAISVFVLDGKKLLTILSDRE